MKYSNATLKRMRAERVQITACFYCKEHHRGVMTVNKRGYVVCPECTVSDPHARIVQ